MKHKKENKAKKNDDFLTKEAKQEQATAEAYTIDIPEDEIWTYQIEGLEAPHINKDFKHATAKKILVVAAIVVAISISMFFSVMVLHSDLYSFKDLDDGTCELIRFSNDGSFKDITIDYYTDSKTGEKDYSKPVTAIHEYAFNCDETVNSITIGKDVKSIDSKSIYSCWWITNVFVDDENPYYCDVDGVLYNKDMTEVIFYPNDHDKYLRLKEGYAELDKDGVQHSLLKNDDGEEIEELIGLTYDEVLGATHQYDEAYFNEYNQKIRTYVVPSTVTKIGELAFAYTNISDIYFPEGLKVLDNMALFKNTQLRNIYSYTTDKPITDFTYKAIDSMKTVYNSLPEGLEFIGSDCFYYLRGMDYVYIPSSVKHIGHHAFWDSVYFDNNLNKLVGISDINIAVDEQTFKDSVETGDQWLPIRDNGLLRKKILVNYSAERKEMTSQKNG